jgi:hypothetical protein
MKLKFATLKLALLWAACFFTMNAFAQTSPTPNSYTIPGFQICTTTATAGMVCSALSPRQFGTTEMGRLTMISTLSTYGCTVLTKRLGAGFQVDYLDCPLGSAMSQAAAGFNVGGELYSTAQTSTSSGKVINLMLVINGY